jgi:hypothetical protein
LNSRYPIPTSMSEFHGPCACKVPSSKIWCSKTLFLLVISNELISTNHIKLLLMIAKTISYGHSPQSLPVEITKKRNASCSWSFSRVKELWKRVNWRGWEAADGSVQGMTEVERSISVLQNAAAATTRVAMWSLRIGSSSCWELDHETMKRPSAQIFSDSYKMNC